MKNKLTKIILGSAAVAGIAVAGSKAIGRFTKSKEKECLHDLKDVSSTVLNTYLDTCLYLSQEDIDDLVLLLTGQNMFMAALNELGNRREHDSESDARKECAECDCDSCDSDCDDCTCECNVPEDYILYQHESAPAPEKAPDSPLKDEGDQN